MLKDIPATVVIVDMRNFTHVYETYRKKDDDTFFRFLQQYYSVGAHFVDVAAFDDDYYVNTTGDGFLVIFFGENHEFSGYLYGLLITKILRNLCTAFNDKSPDEKVWYGIGIESGFVQRISSKQRRFNIDTYLGSVINLAARIESTTKVFNRTNLIIGKRLYDRLIKLLHKDEYERIVKKSDELRKDYTAIISHHNEINILNQKLMLFYLFEHNLKGVDDSIPLFRLSPTLAATDKQRYQTVVRKLCVTEEKYNCVMDEFKQYLEIEF